MEAWTLDISTLAERLLDATSEADGWHRLSSTLRAEGITRTALHCAVPLSAPNPFAAGATGTAFGHVWDRDHDARLRAFQGDVRKTTERDLLHLRPTIMFFSRSRTPLQIDHRRVLDSPGHRAFKPLCRIMVEELGQTKAVAVPLRDPATGTASILSCWCDDHRPDFSMWMSENLNALRLAGQFFLGLHRAWRRADAPAGIVLSDRERQVLALLASGTGTETIADRLGVSSRSVIEYILRARRKLNASTRTEAVAIALRAGVID